MSSPIINNVFSYAQKKLKEQIYNISHFGGKNGYFFLLHELTNVTDYLFHADYNVDIHSFVNFLLNDLQIGTLTNKDFAKIVQNRFKNMQTQTYIDKIIVCKYVAYNKGFNEKYSLHILTPVKSLGFININDKELYTFPAIGNTVETVIIARHPFEAIKINIALFLIGAWGEIKTVHLTTPELLYLLKAKTVALNDIHIKEKLALKGNISKERIENYIRKLLSYTQKQQLSKTPQTSIKVA